MSVFKSGLSFRSKNKTTEVFAPDGSKMVLHGEYTEKLGRTTHAVYSKEVFGPENDPNRQHECTVWTYPNSGNDCGDGPKHSNTVPSENNHSAVWSFLSLLYNWFRVTVNFLISFVIDPPKRAH